MVCQVLGHEDMDGNGKATREQFLDRLQQHVHDINAFVRSKVLQIWLKLFKEQVIPLSRLQQLIPLIVGRLHDKSSIVRRHAIQFLSAVLCANPYSAKLSLTDLKGDLQKAEKKLKELEESCYPGLSLESHSELSGSGDQDEAHTEKMETGDSAMDRASSELVADKVREQGVASVSEKEIQQHQVLVAYLKDCIKFVQHLETATPVICQLLGSKTASDVLEAINFFVMCHEFGISTAKEGVRKMLVLVWSKETAIKEALATAYKRLYIMQESEGKRSRAMLIADNLISLTYGLTLGELASLEELMCQFMRNKDIPHDVIQCLWESFSSEHKDDKATRKSQAAILLLGMLAGENSEIVKHNLDELVSFGLKQKVQGKLDVKKAKLTCIALQKIAKTEKVKPGSLPPPLFRLPCNHSVVESLQQLMLSTLCDFDCVEWIPFAEQAIKTIYKLSEQPDNVCASLIQSMACMLSSQLTTKHQEFSTLIDELQVAEPLAQSSQDPSSSTADILPTPPDMVSSNVTCPSAFLARFLTVSGQVAINQLVHLDVAVYKELKRRQEVEERKKELKKEKEKKETEKKSRKGKRRSSASSKQADDGTSLAEEIGLEGAAAEDTEAETIRQICETEIVTGKNLLSVVRPLVVMVCAQPSKYPDQQLRMAATLALSRFMAVRSVV
jgi:condensin complex subunit 1